MRIINQRNAYFKSTFETRDEESGARFIEGYFAVFNQETRLYDGCFEQVEPRAFDDAIGSGDIRCLFNHETGFVLGRTVNKTLELRVDSHGLWGRVQINPEDSAAADIYARVKRGDISGCSFRFYPTDESYESKDDGLHWHINKADLDEVSICTFPAYPQTEVQARKRDTENAKSQSFIREKETLKSKLEEMAHGTKTT